MIFSDNRYSLFGIMRQCHGPVLGADMTWKQAASFSLGQGGTAGDL